MTTSTGSAGAATSSTASTVGLLPLVTYNWNPATQLSGYLAAQAAVAAGVAGAQATIVAVGDSTTVGFGGSANDYRPTVSYPADLVTDLTQDGVAAQGDNFLGQGNEDNNVPDTRLALFGGAFWGYPFVAGGPIVVTDGIGQGISFTIPTPKIYDRVTIDYLSSGSGTLDVSVDGSPTLAVLQVGNSGLMVSQTIDLPAGLHSSVTITSASANPAEIEGASFWSSTTPAVQVLNAGEGGAESNVVGDGVTPGAGEVAASAALKANLALINFGINDILQGTLTAAQTTANIALMVTEFRANGTDPVIIIPQPFGGANYTAEIATLRADIYQLATTMNVPVIDLSATYNDNPLTLEAEGLLASDNVHPSMLLYSDIASGIATLLTGATAATPPAPTPPAVLLASAPSVANGGSVVLGTVTASGSDSLGVTLKSDRSITSGSTLAIEGGKIVYTPGSYAAAQAGTDSLAYSVVDATNNTVSTETQSVTLQAPVVVPPPMPPAVVLASTPSVAEGGSVVLGTVTASGSDGLGVTLRSDGSIASGSTLAIQGGKIVYTPGSYAAAQAGTDSLAYSVTDTTNNTVSLETQSVTLQAPVIATAPPAVILGSGPQSIVLGISEDAYLGNAMFTVAVDGVQIGGTQTALALHDAGTEQSFTVDGSFTSGTHVLTVDFLNDAYAGTPQTDRNLYVDTIATHGVTTRVNAALLSQGPQSFNVAVAGVAATPPAVSLVPAPTVAAGGSVVLGTATTSNGDALAVSLTSDALIASGSSIALDNGQIVYTPGSYSPADAGADTIAYSVRDASSAAVTDETQSVFLSAPAPSTPPAGTTILGSGPDTLALQISEDAWLGNAQFTVAVDGIQVGGVQTATALHSTGAAQTFDVLGTFAGQNSATVTFLNDAYGGTATTDRNLYVDNATYGGSAVPGSTLTELSGGPMSFLFGTATPTSPASPVVLNLSEDAYQGNAEFTYSIDGGAASAPQSVTALHSAGASEAFSIGNLAAGAHDIAVSFVNDLYAGTPGTDRNLYVNGITVDGTSTPNSSAAILGDWTSHFAIVVPPT
nr:carbohydrate-binding domain-containing protein [uncultured Lichenicoccus sp.]